MCFSTSAQNESCSARWMGASDRIGTGLQGCIRFINLNTRTERCNPALLLAVAERLRRAEGALEVLTGYWGGSAGRSGVKGNRFYGILIPADWPNDCLSGTEDTVLGFYRYR